MTNQVDFEVPDDAVIDLRHAATPIRMRVRFDETTRSWRIFATGVRAEGDDEFVEMFEVFDTRRGRANGATDSREP